MKPNWSVVKLDRVLQHRKEFVTIDDTQSYKRCRVQLHAKGIVPRDTVLGVEVKTKKQQLCRAGEFLVAEIDAKVGGYGIVPDELVGAIVSSHYFLFQVNEKVLNRQFLGYYIQTKDFYEQVKAQGSTNYAAVRPEQVLDYKIPLPPLTEQQRIVARIESLAEKITSAKHLHQYIGSKSLALVDAEINRVIDINRNNASWEFAPIPRFADVNPSRKGKINLNPTESVSFVPMRAVDDETGTIVRPESRPYAETSKGFTWFKDGDVIFARITPCMQNGKSALARNLLNGVGFGSTEFHVMRPGQKISGEWLYTLVRHKSFRDDAASHFKGTAGQQRVPVDFLEQKIIPVPSLDAQHRLVDYINGLKVRVEEIKKLRLRAAVELDALLPSVLDKAFKGELS